MRLPPNAHIYCDMDGVLADFFGGAAPLVARALHPEPPRAWLEHSKSIRAARSEIQHTLGADFRLSCREDLDIPPVRQLILSAISFGAGTFFAQLQPLPGALELLWPALLNTGRPVSLLSAPISNRRGVTGPTAEAGKRRWAQRWLHPPPAAIIITPSRHKHRYARLGGQPNLLIDDRGRNIHQWREAGGLAIHHAPLAPQRTLEALSTLLQTPVCR